MDSVADGSGLGSTGCRSRTESRGSPDQSQSSSSSSQRRRLRAGAAGHYPYTGVFAVAGGAGRVLGKHEAENHQALGISAKGDQAAVPQGPVELGESRLGVGSATVELGEGAAAGGDLQELLARWSRCSWSLSPGVRSPEAVVMATGSR